jgi:hypothetical protein
MLVKNITNTLLGAFLSLFAAYLVIVTFVLKSEIASYGWSSIHPMTIFIGAPLYVLAHFYWIIIPIGLLCGLVIPLLVSKKTRRQALVYGILTGIIIGLVFACFNAYDFAVGTSVRGSDDSVKWWGRFWGDFAWSVPPTIVYCSIWTSSYAFTKAGGADVEHKALSLK